MGTPPPYDADVEATIAEAVAAFDAANHAFGRFVTYGVRPHGEAVPPSVQIVREALQEAALSIPQEPSAEAVSAFLTALRLARDRLAAFFANPPSGYALEEAMQAPGAVDEAIEVLEEALPPPPATPPLHGRGES